MAAKFLSPSRVNPKDVGVYGVLSSQVLPFVDVVGISPVDPAPRTGGEGRIDTTGVAPAYETTLS
jgi:hypothetical protein